MQNHPTPRTIVPQKGDFRRSWLNAVEHELANALEVARSHEADALVQDIERILRETRALQVSVSR